MRCPSQKAFGYCSRNGRRRAAACPRRRSSCARRPCARTRTCRRGRRRPRRWLCRPSPVRPPGHDRPANVLGAVRVADHSRGVSIGNADERVRSRGRAGQSRARVLHSREPDRVVAAQSARGPFALRLVALARDVLENDRRQDAVQAVTAAVHASLPKGRRQGYGDPTPAAWANPPKARICTGNPDQGSLQAAFRAAISVQVRANSPNSMELHRPNVCIACTRARGSGLRRRCRGDASRGSACRGARARRARSMDSRERTVVRFSRRAYCVAAVPIALLLPSERDVSPFLIAGLLLGHAAVSQVRFEFGMGFVVPEQLVIIPMLLLLPLPYVPVLIAVAGAIGLVPDYQGKLVEGPLAEADRGLLVLPRAGLDPRRPGPGTPDLASAPVYALAIAAQLGPIAQDASSATGCSSLPVRELARGFFGATRVELVLTPVAFVATLAAYEEPLVLVADRPAQCGCWTTSRRTGGALSKALELNRAYRGTVMLLSDVIEFEDEYTAQHSRSVVDLVNAVADELGVAPDERQELEFAAMLHDVGKISIPKEILHKPAALTDRSSRSSNTTRSRASSCSIGSAAPRARRRGRALMPRALGRPGYPDGLVGADPYLGPHRVRCDAYNAMTTDRPTARPCRTRPRSRSCAPTPARSSIRRSSRRSSRSPPRALPRRSRASTASAPCSPALRCRRAPAQPVGQRRARSRSAAPPHAWRGPGSIRPTPAGRRRPR